MHKEINITTAVPEMAARGDYMGIVSLFREVQKQVPLTERSDHQAINMNLARAYSAMYNYQAAERSYQAAYEIIPTPEILYYKSITQLHNGKIVEGFRNYKNRWFTEEMIPYYNALNSKGIPYLNKWGDIYGKRILVTNEQGFGDEMMFGRVLLDAQVHANSITRLTPEPLATLCRHNFPRITILTNKLSELSKEHIEANFDIITSIGDLFLAYIVEHGKLPTVKPYSAPNPVYTPGKTLKIGFTYSPGVQSDNGFDRMINPDLFHPFTKEFSFYSFQIGPKCVLGEDLSTHISSFADTADLLDGMDFAITCDTAFAHVALNMGKPTLLVYDKYLDWRFKIDLYPDVTLVSTKDRDFSKKVRNFLTGNPIKFPTEHQLHTCPVCKGESVLLDSVDFNKSCEGSVLSESGNLVDYHLCNDCGFCFCPSIASWSLEEFESKIYNDQYVLVDPDYIEARPKANASYLAVTIGSAGKHIRHLDYGGGNGLLSSILKGVGWKSTSYDPFVNKNIGIRSMGKFDMITAFEVFEHVPDPQQLMVTLKSLLASGGNIMFSTLLSDGNVVSDKKLDWWYASPRNGHISLFSRSSIQMLADQHGFTFTSINNNLHVFSRLGEIK